MKGSPDGRSSMEWDLLHSQSCGLLWNYFDWRTMYWILPIYLELVFPSNFWNSKLTFSISTPSKTSSLSSLYDMLEYKSQCEPVLSMMKYYWHHCQFSKIAIKNHPPDKQMLRITLWKLSQNLKKWFCWYCFISSISISMYRSHKTWK